MNPKSSDGTPKKRIQTKKVKPQPTPQSRLIKLTEVEVTLLEEGQCRIRTELLFNNRSFNCERTGPNEPDYRIMMAALSALGALEQLTENNVKMELLFIERQQLANIGREIIMVLIDVSFGETTRAATGACQIQGEPTETAARAVLDATNRIIELYLDSLSE